MAERVHVEVIGVWPTRAEAAEALRDAARMIEDGGGSCVARVDDNPMIFVSTEDDDD